ncbi:MAG: Dna2/Cas4 domain-containing protein [Candidatus Subteraquimicrobiales bacterium]|nr:Dna2/Cas4 domain-containing protein [Candidatus Subteraquimicrobiales bacterium]
MQLAFYLYRLKQAGIEAKGELLIPKEKKKIPVTLNSNTEKELEEAMEEISDCWA